jgi:hypothetical protein
MSKTWIAALVAVLALPALAQEEPAEVVEAPAEESAEPAEAPAEAAPAEDAGVEEVAEADPTEQETEPAPPWALYVGADYVNTTLSRSVPPTDPANEFESTMVRVRVGKRLFEAIGAELHVGVDQADEDAGEVTTDAYYGLFLVPTATLFDVLELGFPIGYARSEYGDDGEALDSIAYGASLELPIRVLWDALPDVRLTSGAMVYYQKSDARVYGANFGLRFDFTL